MCSQSCARVIRWACLTVLVMMVASARVSLVLVARQSSMTSARSGKSSMDRANVWSWYRSVGARWHGVVRVAVEVSAGNGYADPAPLFEEEQGALLVALCFDGAYPFGAHGSCAGAAFAAHDDPVDAREVDGAEVFKEWFDAQEPEACGCATQLVDSWDAVLLVLDADAPPDMLCHRCLWEVGGEELLEAVGAFGEDLVGVPVGPKHDGGDGRDVLVGHGVLEEIAHAVDEHRARGWPLEWFEELSWDEPWVKAVLVGVAWHVAEAFGEGFCVAVFASGADLHAATNGVPGGVRPFDFCRRAQWYLSFLEKLFPILA